jgi:Flp pilus assembly protein TadG
MRFWEARSKRGLRDDHGANLVEFALVMPLLLLLIFGTFEFGRLIATQVALNSAAREGARFGTTIGDRNLDGVPNFADCDEIREVAKQRAVMAKIDDSDIEVFYDKGEGTPVYADCQPAGIPPAADTVATGDRLTVVVRGTFTSNVPLISLILNDIGFEAKQSRTIFRAVVDD